jgi:cytochrome c
MNSSRLAPLTLAASLLISVQTARAQMMGHGGPVRTIAVSADGTSLLSGGFDTAAIRWSLARESAEQVLRFHSDAVNAVGFLTDRRMVTAGADAHRDLDGRSTAAGHGVAGTSGACRRIGGFARR